MTHKLPFIEQYEDLFGKKLDLPLYEPVSSKPKTNSLSRAEHERMLEDLSDKPVSLVDYISFCADMVKSNVDEGIYLPMLKKLMTENKDDLEFARDQHKLLSSNLEDFDNDITNAIEYFNDFYKKYKSRLWHNQNFYNALNKLQIKESLGKTDLFGKILRQVIKESQEYH